MDKKTVERLYIENKARLCRMAMSILADEEESRDVVNDVFTRFLSADISCSEGDEATFVGRCVRNECLNHMKHKSVRERFERLYSECIIEDETADSYYDADALLTFVAENFTERQQQVFRMRFIDGMKYGEIARELAVSHAAVYKHIVRCIDMIKNNFING